MKRKISDILDCVQDGTVDLEETVALSSQRIKLIIPVNPIKSS